MRHIKYHVGRFSHADQQGSLNVVATVEKEASHIAPVYFFHFDKHDKSGHDNVVLKSIEVRALIRAINIGAKYEKDHGGSGKHKKLIINSNDKYIYLGLIVGELKLNVSFKPFEIEGFADELSQLVDIANEACYKTQQHLERKKLIIKLEEEKQKNGQTS